MASMCTPKYLAGKQPNDIFASAFIFFLSLEVFLIEKRKEKREPLTCHRGHMGSGLKEPPLI